MTRGDGGVAPLARVEDPVAARGRATRIWQAYDDRKDQMVGIKTLQEEWAYGLPYKSSDRRNANLQRWLDIYNCERPHGGINMQTPISRLQPNP